MALFRCASGGGGGGQITVTYDSDFYGETITCTRGQKVYSKVASSSGSVVFVVNEEGDWDIECTVGGVPYSTVASIEFTTSTELVAVPDGSTATPTDDVGKWLECAGIRDKNYTTLSQVLSDSETFNALLGDSNACAYMARSTTWAKRLTPTMTSNTTPSGEAYGSTYYNANPYWHAFDDNDSTSWAPSSNNVGEWLGYKFPTAVKCKSVGIKTVSSDSAPYSFKVQASNNADFSTIGYESSEFTVSTEDYTSFDFEPNGEYLYYRIYILTWTTWFYAVCLNFYANNSGIGLTESQYAMSMIGQYDVCCDALLGNATWASAIASSSYADYVLDTKVPTMTSATTPEGEVIASGYLNPYYPYYVFTDTASTLWLAESGATNNFIGYKFTSPVQVNRVTFTWHGGGVPTRTFTVQGSQDNSTWDDLGTFTTNASSAGETNDVSFANDTAYLYYRIFCADVICVNGSWGYHTDRVQFYGRTSSGEYIHGTNDEVAYYLDGATQTPIVDPSTLSAGTYTFGSTVAKDPSDLTADYTKTIRITPNTKEIVLRPDKSLYWYGVVLSAYRTTTYVQTGASINRNAPTVTPSIYKLQLSNTSGYAGSVVWVENTSCTDAHLIGKIVTLPNYGALSITINSDATVNSDYTVLAQDNTTTIGVDTYFHATYGSGGHSITTSVGGAGNSLYDISAVWYE